MDRVRAKSHLQAALATAALLIAGVSPLAAHPHVWITVQSVVLYEQGSIAAIGHTWTFDEMYTAMAIQGLDANNDGNYDRKELAELAQVNMDGLKEFAYFTHVKLADHALALENPKDYYLEYVEANVQGESEPKRAGRPKALSLHFKLPLKQPVLAEAPGFTFSVSDPTFFIAFELAKDSPVTLGAGAPSVCRVSIGGAAREAEDTKRLGESFFNQMGAQGFGLNFAKPIAVVCEPK